MRLSTTGCENYSVEPSLSPTATGTWQASFDNGATYIDGIDAGNGSWTWLVAGPAYAGGAGTPVHTFAAGETTIVPRVGLTAGTERIEDYGPVIEVV